MYALNLSADGRVQSVCYVFFNTPQNMPRVDSLPDDGDITEYLYVDGIFAHAPLPVEPTPQQVPTTQERMEAQLTYTAMMTDTLLPSGTESEAANV